MVNPKRACGTRWLSHTAEALTNLFKGYKGFVLHLGQESQDGKSKMKPKAQSLLKLLTNRSIIVFSHFLLDLLNVMKTMSLGLQEKSTSLYECHKNLEISVASLEKMKSRPGFHLRSIIDKTDFHGQHLKGTLDMHTSAVSNIIPSLVESLKTRYSDVTGDLIQSTKLVDLKLWPQTVDDAHYFGDNYVEKLVDYFQLILVQSGVAAEHIEQEWTSLKTIIYDNNKPNDLNWEVINEQYSEGHQNFLALVDLVLSLPASTAECERGFSHMKLTKTDRRNKLKSTTMSDLMMVKLVSDDIASFNPLPAIHQWNSSSHRARRASYMQTKQKAGQTGLPQLPEVPDLNEVVEAAGESSAAREPNKYYDSDQDSDFSDLGFSDSESDNLDLDEAAEDLD